MKTTPLLLGLSLAIHSLCGSSATAGAIPAARAEALPEELRWLVLSPIPVREAADAGKPDDSAQKKAFAGDLLTAHGGEANAQPKAGDVYSVHGVERTWSRAATVDGAVSLRIDDQPSDFMIAYASAEFDAPTAMEAWLGVGSDDGIKVWLNGTLVHEHWSGRPVQVDQDVVPVTLKAGRNHLLLKVQNMSGGWGFACRLMDTQARADRLVGAVNSGDLEATKQLLAKGFDVNAAASSGLTPYAAARISGRIELAELLAQHGADTQAPIPPADRLVDTLLASRFAPNGAGAAVLVARDGEILFEQAYGLADVERNLPLSVDTKFRIGSVTKQFTAAAILRLQEAGKLLLTDPLTTHYDGFVRGDEVTLRHLLTHTSGIHSYTATPQFLRNVEKPTTSADVVSSIKQFAYDFDPGARWEYCNSGYFLLGDIIEKVSGQSYAQYLHDTFFAPLEMPASGVYENASPPAGMAVGHEFRDGAFRKALDWDMSWAGAAGAMYSTVRDLYRWNEAVFGGRVLSDENLAAALTPVITEQNKNDSSDSGYGYGWGISRFRGAREISHGGGLHGFLSHLLRFPDHAMTVVVLVNSSPPKPRADPGTLAREIAELYLGAELAPRKPAASTEATTISAAARAAVAGRYDYRNAIMEITVDGDQMFAQLGPQPRFEIFPQSETEFFWKVVDARVTFVKNDADQVVTAIHHQNGQTLHAPRLPDVAEVNLNDAQTDPLLGEYDFQPVGKMTISREDGRMFGQLTGQPKMELGAKSETEFFVRLVNAQLIFVKADGGNVTKLLLQQGGQKYELPKIGAPDA